MDLAAALNENGTGVNGAGAGLGGEETLNSVLYSVFCEFLDGDFQMIRVLVNALNESNPGLNLGEDAVDSIEGAFAKLRELMMGERTLRVVALCSMLTFASRSWKEVSDHHSLRADPSIRDTAFTSATVLL